jgi:hypothetical protein
MLMRAGILGGLLALGACSGGGGVDAYTVDIDNGSCGDQLHFTGEYVDWDKDVTFCGINEATIQVEGDGAMDTTAPNGRFDLCIPRMGATTKLIVTQPANPSMCTSTAASYTVPTILWASHDVILGGGFYSARAFTTARQASFFQAIGLTFDATKAQVFVHVDGPQRAVSLAATHDAPQTIVASNWAAGDSGHEVFFPNVDATGGTTLLIVNGGAIGAGSIPLVAGTITNVSLLVH